ncbi:SNF2 domain-containing protein CLASSY 4-like [Abeliophyllum distichum]|uniref:SNF2 domain-containing protein CLASSY 4-like n=1 Tax=Abeliophyllum distichum TaxID=126358 RepID=A0ABD1PDE9_9LAMI
MHASSPSSSSVARRTRRQSEIFYRNLHNEVKKNKARENVGNGGRYKGMTFGENTGGVGDNEGSYSVNIGSDEISREKGVREGERVDEGSDSEIIGKNADKMGSVSGGSSGKRKIGQRG